MCSTIAVGGCGGGENAAPAPSDFAAQASDFECLQNWDKVRNFRITNKLGYTDEALALARRPEPGKQYPVGTIIQIFPGEAMVKRGPDFDPDNHSWEYFQLNVSAGGTEIVKRGRDEVVNFLNLNCFTCHSAARDFDFICEEDHGCVKLPVTGEQIAHSQDTDPRCPASIPAP